MDSSINCQRAFPCHSRFCTSRKLTTSNAASAASKPTSSVRVQVPVFIRPNGTPRTSRCHASKHSAADRAPPAHIRPFYRDRESREHPTEAIQRGDEPNEKTFLQY